MIIAKTKNVFLFNIDIITLYKIKCNTTLFVYTVRFLHTNYGNKWEKMCKILKKCCAIPMFMFSKIADKTKKFVHFRTFMKENTF